MFIREVTAPCLASIVSGLVMSHLATAPVPVELAVAHERAAMSRGETHDVVRAPDAPSMFDAPVSPLGLPVVEPEPVSAPSRAGLEAIARDRYERHGMSRYAGWLLDQVTAESRWDPDAVSPVGAAGLSQIMPATYAVDLADYTDPPCTDIPRTDPRCSTEGQAVYMGRLLRRYDSIELATAAYNAGLGHVDKEVARCAAALGCDPLKWIGHVEHHCGRAAWACKQTREYVARIARAVRERRVDVTVSW